MPAKYDDEDWQRDILEYQAFINFLGRKSSGMLGGPCALDFNGQGHKRQLTSNYMEGNLRNPPAFRIRDGDYAGQPPTGILEEFWTTEPLDAQEVFVGALNLLGEIPDAAALNRAQAVRCDYLAVQRASHAYVALLSNMMG